MTESILDTLIDFCNIMGTQGISAYNNRGMDMRLKVILDPHLVTVLLKKQKDLETVMGVKLTLAQTLYYTGKILNVALVNESEKAEYGEI